MDYWINPDSKLLVATLLFGLSWTPWKHRIYLIRSHINLFRDLTIMLLLTCIVRFFIFDIVFFPSESMEPTFNTGSIHIANKHIYGLLLPVTHTRLTTGKIPKAGETIGFHYPKNKQHIFTKRIIGLPGDHIEYRAKVLYINGKEQTRTVINSNKHIQIFRENLQGVEHLIKIDTRKPSQNISITVPPGKYLVIGDNRDYSFDSRYWGFLPQQFIIMRL